MIVFPSLPGVEVNLFLLIFIGFTVGIVGGFIGVGGGYMITPALMVLGFPANFAVGIGVTHITAKSLIATVRHKQLGNVDAKMGCFMIAGTMAGVEIGVRLLNWAREMGVADEAVLSASIVVLLGITAYTFQESAKSKAKLDELLKRKEKLPRDMRVSSIPQKVQHINIPPMIYFSKSRLTISLWVILAVGFFTGALAGFMGVGGGFIRVPSLIYLVGTPSIIAVGTDLFEIIISGSYSLIRHTMSGNVIIFAAVCMVLGASVGAQIGALGTRYVRGVSIRYILGYSVFLAAVGAMFKLAYIFTGESINWLQSGAQIIIFGSMGLLVSMIIALVTMAVLHRRGRTIPVWAESLVSKED